MGDFVRGLAPASRSMRGFQVLNHRDLGRLERFFLAFDSARRRKYFGGGISDPAVRHFCRAIRWSETTVIARASASDLDAIAMMTGSAGERTAELSIACAPSHECPSTVADLLDLALTVASLSYSDLTVSRPRATPELLALLDRCAAVCEGDLIRIAVPSPSASIIAC